MQFAATLPSSDIVLGEDGGSALDDAAGYIGQAWCPTPSALRRWTLAGVRVPRIPGFEVLQQANHRAFISSLTVGLPHADEFEESDAAWQHMRRADTPDVWRLKRPFTFSGRGHRRLDVRRPAQNEEGFLRRSLREDGVVYLEPEVVRVADYVLHGYVSENGQVDLAEPMRQECSDRGQWIRTVPHQPGEFTENERHTFLRTGEQVGRALAAIHYFGPFGMDAFRWQDDSGHSHFLPLCDLNARYTMGWFVGMKTFRPPVSVR